jgi:hypothetical protein
LDQSENSCVGADAESQRGDGGDGKSWRFAQLP